MILAVFFIVVATGIGAIYSLFRLALVEQFNDTLLTNAVAISALVTTSGTIGQLPGSDRIMRDFGHGEDEGFFEVRRADGAPLVRSESLHGGDLPRPEQVARRPRFRRIQLADGRALTSVDLFVNPGVRTPPGGQAGIAPMVLSVAMDRNEVDELLVRLALICGAIVLLLTAAAFVIPPLLRRLLNPLDNMALQTSIIDADSLDTRLPVEGLPSELRPIAECLNELFSRLERSFERERRVTADLAHELRTPLAELRTWVSSALKWPESRDPSTDREIMDATRHMEAIVTQMLALARSELGKLPLRVESVDIAALLRSTWRSFEPRSVAKELRIGWSLAPAASKTDPAVLRSILANLFENAVEYTPAGGEIFIESGEENGGVAVRITNTASNLNRQDVSRFFERFWRKEEARSSEQHVGLGLAIAQSFARSLGWRLEADLSENQLLTFTLTTMSDQPV